LCNNLNSNPKQFYNTFNPFLNHKKDACAGNNITLNINGNLETNQEIAAEHFAGYFSTIANNIGGREILNLKEDNFSAHVCIQSIKETLSGSDTPPFTFSSVQLAELIKEMGGLSANKAPGHDDLPPKLLKMIFKEIALSLCTIFNTSIETAAWPETWKRGTWTPVFKKVDRHDRSNYRPITVLHVVGRIYEKLLSKQIPNFMDPIIKDNLTAYRKSQDCKTTLNRLVEEWKMELDGGKLAKPHLMKTF